MELCFILLTIFFSNSLGQEFPLGEISEWGEHEISSGEATLLSDKKLQITNFHYDGEGPAAWFMVGKEKDGYTEERVELDGLIIPNEKGSCDILGAYDDENITLTIPKGMKFTDYSYLSVYCIENNHNFGYFRIKDEYAFTTPAPILLVNVTTGEITQQRDLSEDDAPENCDQENLVRRRRRDLGTPYRKYQLR